MSWSMVVVFLVILTWFLVLKHISTMIYLPTKPAVELG